MRLTDLVFTYWWVCALFIGAICLISLIILACCAWIALQVAIEMYQERHPRRPRK
jgi:hypothetical protein